jgi:hypothetical protein
MHITVDVDQDALGGEPLRAVAGHGIAMVEMGHSFRIERDDLVAIGYTDGEPIFADCLDDPDIAIGYAQLFI